MNYTDYNLCENITLLRKTRNYSLAYTAKNLHISVKTLKCIERGRLPKKANPELSRYASLLFNIPEKSLYIPPQSTTYLVL